MDSPLVTNDLTIKSIDKIYAVVSDIRDMLALEQYNKKTNNSNDFIISNTKKELRLFEFASIGDYVFQRIKPYIVCLFILIFLEWAFNT